MDFREAIEAHTRWKLHLHRLLASPSENDLDSKTAARDDQCDLGRWIHGEGQRFADLAEFGELVTQHAAFHGCAAEVIQKIAAGDKRGGEAFLAPGGSYNDASDATVLAIVRLQRRIAKSSP